MEKNHHVLMVPVKVKSTCIEQFATAANENAAESRKEPGVIRFEVLQNQEDETSFMLVEVYHTPQGHLAHQQTPHYLRFREIIPTFLQEPYQRALYQFISSAL